MNVLKTLLVLYTALLVSAPAGAQLRPPTRTTGQGYDGAIIDRDSQRGQRNSGKTPTGWTPTEEDVRKAERALPVFLVSSEAVSKLQHTRITSQLARYKRQYWGEFKGSRRFIRMLFYRDDTPVVQKGTWLRTAVSVSGGGESYFQVTYDVDRSHFTNLFINAPE